MRLAAIALLFAACASVDPPCETGSRCNGLCVDLQSSPTSCGECGNFCELGEACFQGECISQCPRGLDECTGRCLDFSNDPDHCGSCDVACADGQVCLGKICSDVCPAPRIACDGVCVDPQSDQRNCGACGAPCGAGLVCVEGECSSSCQAELTNCNGRCVDVDIDGANCGDCGHDCDDGYVCDRGGCVFACPPGESSCGLLCADLDRDPTRCGDCATRCEAGEYCEAGTCVPTCSAGLEVCDGACVDTDHDPVHCGDCGVECADQQACLDGACHDCVDCDTNVLIVYSASAGYLTDVDTKLEGTGAFQTVDVFNAGAGTPAAALLDDYDAVLVFSDSGFSDAATLGDRIADFFDAGGSVVIATFANASVPIRGRFGTVANGYMLIDPTGQEQPVDSIGAINEPLSPLVEDVVDLDATSAYRSTGNAINGGIVVAEWSGGEPLIVRGVVDGRDRCDVNFYPPSSGARADFWTGDGTEILRNALLFR